MPVNATLATYSDYAFHSAVGIYLLAMLLHLGEYAKTRVPAALAKVPVAAGAAEAPAADTEVPLAGEAPSTATGRPWRERFDGSPGSPRSAPRHRQRLGPRRP